MNTCFLLGWLFSISVNCYLLMMVVEAGSGFGGSELLFCRNWPESGCMGLGYVSQNEKGTFIVALFSL